jgi:hypothetical protein
VRVELQARLAWAAMAVVATGVRELPHPMRHPEQPIPVAVVVAVDITAQRPLPVMVMVAQAAQESFFSNTQSLFRL